MSLSAAARSKCAGGAMIVIATPQAVMGDDLHRLESEMPAGFRRALPKSRRHGPKRRAGTMDDPENKEFAIRHHYNAFCCSPCRRIGEPRVSAGHAGTRTGTGRSRTAAVLRPRRP